MEKIFYAGAVVVTNRSGVKINKATEKGSNVEEVTK